MVLQLDPQLPLVWRDPHSVQFGVDSPVAVLQGLSNAEERMIAALVAGVSRGGLELVADRAGVDRGVVTLLLERLAPALRSPARSIVPPGSMEPPLSGVVVTGVGATADRVRSSIVGARYPSAVPAEPTRGVRLAVIVAHFVVDPADRGRWLRRDIPHLPVVLGDTSVRLGPIVEPGAGPCLHCLELHRTDADAAWPAIATQLLGRRSALDGALLAGEVAGIACRRALARLAGARDDAVATTLENGEASSREWAPHPECGCLAIAGMPTVR